MADDNKSDTWSEFESRDQSDLRPGQPRSRDEIDLPDVRDPMMALAWYREKGNPLFAWAAIGGFLERQESLDDDLRKYLVRLSRVVIDALNKQQTMESCRQIVLEALYGSQAIASEDGGGCLKGADWNRIMKDTFSESYEFLRDQKIVAAIDDLVLRRDAINHKVLKRSMSEEDAKKFIITKNQMIESVAIEYGVNSKTVRRIYYRDRTTKDIFAIESDDVGS